MIRALTTPFSRTTSVLELSDARRRQGHLDRCAALPGDDESLFIEPDDARVRSGCRQAEAEPASPLLRGFHRRGVLLPVRHAHRSARRHRLSFSVFPRRSADPLLRARSPRPREPGPDRLSRSRHRSVRTPRRWGERKRIRGRRPLALAPEHCSSHRPPRRAELRKRDVSGADPPLRARSPRPREPGPDRLSRSRHRSIRTPRRWGERKRLRDRRPLALAPVRRSLHRGPRQDQFRRRAVSGADPPPRAGPLPGKDRDRSGFRGAGIFRVGRRAPAAGRDSSGAVGATEPHAAAETEGGSDGSALAFFPALAARRSPWAAGWSSAGSSLPAGGPFQDAPEPVFTGARRVRGTRLFPLLCGIPCRRSSGGDGVGKIGSMTANATTTVPPRITS